MTHIAKVDGLWRYPVKSMRGQELDECFLGYSGVYGDRLFAFKSDAAPRGFPYLTGREQHKMLQYRPRFRDPEKWAQPPNCTEAMAMGVTPLHADPADSDVEVQTPSGKTLAINDSALIGMLSEGISDKHTLSLLQSERGMTDCRPVSLFSVQTAQQLGRELGIVVDRRRFRANIYLDFNSADGFREDTLIGRSLRIGSNAIVSIVARDSRCKMITLDPDTSESNPEILRKVVQAHGGTAGVYGAVLVEGTLRKGDTVSILD